MRLFHEEKRHSARRRHAVAAETQGLTPERSGAGRLEPPPTKHDTSSGHTIVLSH